MASEAGFDRIDVSEHFVPTLRKGDEQLDVLIIDLEIGEEACHYACATAIHNGLARSVAVLGPADYTGVRELLSMGVKGYLSVQSDDSFFRSALRSLLEGYMVLDPHVTARFVSFVVKDQRQETGLSERELEVVRLVGRGESNKRIARELGLSENSVKTYLARAFDKLGARSRPEAAAALARLGLL